jgi:hypothetical protein
VSYTSLANFSLFLHFFYTLGAALTRASSCSGHRPRRLWPLRRDGLCIRGWPPGGGGIASNSKCVLVLFLAFCVSCTHQHPVSARYVPLDDFRLVGTAVHMPAVVTRFLPFPFHWTTFPSRGLSLATAGTNKNLDDVMCIPVPWDAEALEQFHPGTAPHWRPSPALQPHCFCFSLLFFPAMFYGTTTVIYISCLTSQYKGALGSSRYTGSRAIFRDCISASMPCI